MEYIKPQTTIRCLEVEGFLCESVKNLTFITEVDEYSNMGTETLTFDE